MNHDNIALSN